MWLIFLHCRTPNNTDKLQPEDFSCSRQSPCSHETTVNINVVLPSLSHFYRLVVLPWGCEISGLKYLLIDLGSEFV